MNLIRKRWREALAGDDGSMLIVLPIIFTGLFMLLGVVLDGAVKVNAQQSVYLAAADAARAGASEIDVSDQLLKGETRINPAEAVNRAQTTLDRRGMSGDVSVNPSGTAITVTARDRFSTTLLKIIGINGGTVEATETARFKVVK